jgi:RecJ-like exonuclease
MREHDIDDQALAPGGETEASEETACPDCGGTGLLRAGETCPGCGGTGKPIPDLGGG